MALLVVCELTNKHVFNKLPFVVCIYIELVWKKIFIIKVVIINREHCTISLNLDVYLKPY